MQKSTGMFVRDKACVNFNDVIFLCFEKKIKYKEVEKKIVCNSV